MRIAQALNLVSRYDAPRNPLTSLSDILDPELIARCLVESGTVTLRKRRLLWHSSVTHPNWCGLKSSVNSGRLRHDEGK